MKNGIEINHWLEGNIVQSHTIEHPTKTYEIAKIFGMLYDLVNSIWALLE